MASKYCGDYQISPGEQCDDGNIVSGDGCSATCQVEFLPNCGNNTKDLGEECDDGNLRDNDGCSRLCRLETGFCGDGTLQTALNEQCDDGNNIPNDGCSYCAIDRPSDCGNGVVEEGELCDLGDRNSMNPSMCRPNCITPRCGDRVLDFNEECDDGNNINGDACSATCELERGGALATNPYANLIAGQIDTRNLTPEQQQYISSLTPEQQLEFVRQQNRVPSPVQTKTGPGLVIFLASGAAAGVGFMRRRTLKSK